MVDAEINPAVTKAKESADLASVSAEAAAGSASDAAESAKQAKEAAESGGGSVDTSDAVSDFSDGKQAGKLIKVGENGNIKVPSFELYRASNRNDDVLHRPLNTKSMRFFFPEGLDPDSVIPRVPYGTDLPLAAGGAAASVKYVDSKISNHVGIRFEATENIRNDIREWNTKYNLKTGEKSDFMDSYILLDDLEERTFGIEKTPKTFMFTLRQYIDMEKLDNFITDFEFAPIVNIRYSKYENVDGGDYRRIDVNQQIASAKSEHEIRYNKRGRSDELNYYTVAFSDTFTVEPEMDYVTIERIELGGYTPITPDKVTLDIIRLV